MGGKAGRQRRYANFSDYVRDLNRKDVERAEKIARMQTLIDEALESGISTRTMEDIWNDAMKQYEAERGAAGGVAGE